jgi:hypothetical protein
MAQEIRRGLWIWTAPHPEWEADEDGAGAASWPREVGCVLYETATHAVFIDPLAPQGDPAFWRWADERCGGREVSVLETIRFHRRSRDEFVARYGASTAVPECVEAVALPAFDETLYWIAEHRALVSGDVLVAFGADGLSLCDLSWLESVGEKPSLSDLRAALSVALRDLDVQLVLVSHGEPVLAGAADALARALRAT